MQIVKIYTVQPPPRQRIAPKRSALLALALIASAGSLQAANIPISSLPFSITAPGTYVLTVSPPTYGNPALAAISITMTVPGAVVLDLGGHTLTGLPNCTGVTVQRAQSVSNPSAITVRNGIIQGFGYSVVVGVDSPAYSSRIHIEGLTLTSLQFNQCNNSTVSNCTFVGSSLIGLQDSASKGGNVYTNNFFDGNQLNPIVVNTQGTNNPVVPLLLEYCKFAPPPAN